MPQKCTQCGADAIPAPLKKDRWGRVRQAVQLCERCSTGQGYDPRDDPKFLAAVAQSQQWR